ncbi:uncharacterized protein LOC142341766 [Convolutriloba macropyga]|uniref:uncharacterized protein LOC142341766 n=1 Tax=Convolutriloba macropyga TaxID=536237 RepID=UPI003F522322
MQPSSGSDQVPNNASNIRVQIPPSGAQNIRMSGAPQTVQIISAPGTVSGSGGVTPARLSGPGGQPVTLLQGPRTAGGQLQRVVIRPHTIASPNAAQFGVRPIAPAPRPSHAFQPAANQQAPALQQQNVHIVNTGPSNPLPRPVAPNPARLASAANLEIGLNRTALGGAPKPRFSTLESTAAPNPKLKHAELLDRSRIQDLVNEVDPNQELDEDVQNLLLEIADDFIEKTITASCQIAQHRNAATLETSDVQLSLERNYNMWIPGFSDSPNSDDPSSSALSNLFSKGSNVHSSSRKNMGNEAHKQRMAVLRKTLKK